MSKSYLLALLLLIAFSVLGQERCSTNAIPANQNRKESDEKFEEWLSETREKRSLQKRIAHNQQSILSIPIVFHIIHDGSPVGFGSNLSDEKILEQLDIINKDFSRTNEDANNTPSIFLPVAADTEIRFVLAKQDPEGMPTSGIVRIQGSKSSYNPKADDILLKSESQWPPGKYLNFYITNLISGNLGYAQFPFSNLAGIGEELANYESTDGVVLDYEWVGVNTETKSFDSHGRTATHEIGHYLGLRHVWGDGGCFRDDYCEDTPPDSGSTTGCPETKVSCEDQRAMFENFMDYTDDECMNIFTLCQKERMHTILQESPRRVSLLTSPGLITPQLRANDLGIRSIIAPTQAACNSVISPGVQVRNYGLDIISSFGIEFYLNDQLQSSKLITTNLNSGQTTEINFDPINLNGEVSNDIVFQITAVNGKTDENTTNNAIKSHLAPVSTVVVPYFEDFGNGINHSFTENNTPSSWLISTAPDTSLSNQAAYLPFHNQSNNFGYKDALVTRTLDLSALTSVQLDFSYAYAARTTLELDGLLVIVSTDCGATFPKENIVFERYGRALRTTGYSDFSFIPGDESDWDQMSINLTRFAGQEQVQVAIVGVNGAGNNLYIDNISITSANLLAYDIGIKNVDRVPIVTCDEQVYPRIEIKNYGFEDITDFTIDIEMNDQLISETFTDLDLSSGETEFFTLKERFDLEADSNYFHFNISQINGRTDQQISNNAFKLTTLLSDNKDAIPVQEKFDVLTWQVANPTGLSLLDTTVIDGNYVLVTNSFRNTSAGKSFLVSPTLSTKQYNQAAIRFDYSYGQRAGYNDNLKVLLSTNCGDDFDVELLSLNAEQLASAMSNTEWVPSAPEHWKQAFVDISEYTSWPEIRIALAFTNGNGNRLYIDNLNVLTTNDPSLPEFDNKVRLYPNPAQNEFHLAFNFPEKQEVNVKVIDMSGKIVFDEDFGNLINQTLNLMTPHQSGFYLVQVTGTDVNYIKRLYIRH